MARTFRLIANFNLHHQIWWRPYPVQHSVYLFSWSMREIVSFCRVYSIIDWFIAIVMSIQLIATYVKWCDCVRIVTVQQIWFQYVCKRLQQSRQSSKSCIQDMTRKCQHHNFECKVSGQQQQQQETHLLSFWIQRLILVRSFNIFCRYFHAEKHR